MHRICAWCHRDLTRIDFAEQDVASTSHGICVDCAEQLALDDRMTLAEFLDTLDAPVVVVDEAHETAFSNTRAKTLYPAAESTIPPASSNEPRHPLSTLPPPVVHDCIASSELGGCKRTLHCAGCTIRRAVMKTYMTGEETNDVPACLTKDNPDSPEEASLWVSTSLVEKVVVVQVTPSRQG